ncbi:glycosyltransferase family 2 protein [Roseburia faecis]|uniref:glycosyltransferase family 2 protein n=1 Tax=Roseburia faecis TaxID=301302 RepID=UPI003F95CBA4
MNDLIISIICPLYYGGKYVKHIVEMIEKNYELASRKKRLAIELILVNDCSEQIETFSNGNENLSIKFIQNQKNEGIHYSRIRGLRESRGEYILFLDQDDDIMPEYILKQLTCIKDYDAVICNGFNNGHEIYYSEKMICAACDKEMYLDGGNRIISPGQVLIKRSSIPIEWTRNILKTNGADDYFLWLLMFLKNLKFTYNYTNLYIHNTTDSNTSDNFTMMKESVAEVLKKIYKEGMFSDLQYERIKKVNGFSKDEKEELLVLYQRSRKIQIMLDLWLTNKEEHKSCERYLKSLDANQIVIYGCGVLGRHLIKELQSIDITVEAIIDRDISKGVDGIKTIKIGDEISSDSIIVVTPLIQQQNIVNELEKYYGNKIIYINQIIDFMQ